MPYSVYSKSTFIIILSVIFAFSVRAQQLLNKPVSLHVTNEPLQKVLEQIGNQGSFHFSYNSSLVPGDSLVSLSVQAKTVRQVLDLLFHGRLLYKETQGLVILQRSTVSQHWYISGYIADGISGERLNNVSVYEPGHLEGTITDESGFFRLQLKEKNNYPPVIAISVSRVSYEDTAFSVNAGYNQEVQISIIPSDNSLESIVVSPRVQRTWLGKWLISSRLKKQTANLRNFLATKPIQFSLTPGLGSHGQLGAQVVNKFSFSVLGGYSAGVNGFELGGLFNITKDNMHKMQVGGLFNIVGGHTEGLQVAGLYNKVFDSVKGLQVAGLVNIVRGAVNGMQVSGISGSVSGGVNGMAVSGIVHTIAGDLDGLQLSGITSITDNTVNGTQISGIYNYARNLKGLQIGFINYADTSTGYSIGFLNINKVGYHRFSLSASELLDITFAYKAGNRNLYTILLGGANVFRKKAYGVGYGLGNELKISPKFSFINELFTMGYYNGDWHHLPVTTTLRTSFNVRVLKKVYIHAGPALSGGERVQLSKDGFACVIPGRTLFTIGNSYKGWLGWQAGISL